MIRNAIFLLALVIAGCGGASQAPTPPERRVTVVVSDAIPVGTGRMVGTMTLTVLSVQFVEAEALNIPKPANQPGWILVRLRAANATGSAANLPGTTIVCGGATVGGPTAYSGEGAFPAGAVTAAAVSEGYLVFAGPKDCPDGEILMTAPASAGPPVAPVRFSFFR